MKKGTVLLAVLFFSIHAFANHILGGEITWRCQGNGKYVLKLVVYGDCSDLPISNTAFNMAWNGPGNIVVNRTHIDTISPQCYKSSASITCDSTIIYTPVVRHQYESAPFTIPGPVPASGYHFHTAIQARPSTDNTTNGGTNGYILRATMYPYFKNGVPVDPAQCYDSSPAFDEMPRYAFAPDTNAFYLDGYDVDEQDSIAFVWAPSINYGSTYPGTPIGYQTGYAYNHPLPGSIINSANSGAVLDYTGKLSFKSVTVGRFTTCYKIESWRNGYKIAEVFRDFEMQVQTDPGTSGVCSSSQNFPPTLALMGVAGYDSLSPVYANGRLQYYQVSIFAGDSVSFKMNMQDYDLNPSCASQSILASVKGSSMSASDTGSSDCTGAPCANLISLNSGGAYVSPLNNQTQFFWKTDTANAYGPSGQGTHWFTIIGTDDHCVLPGESQLKVRVNVMRPIYVSNGHPGICAGDTAQLHVLGDTTNLSWSPSAGISCANCASPKVYPATTTTYTVTDNNTGYSESVLVEVNVPLAKPQLSQSGSVLTLNNASLYDTAIWQRSHAPLSVSGNTVDAWLSGEYWVNAQNGACIQQSDTINVWNTGNMVGTSAAGGSFDSLRVENATYSMSISLNKEPYYTINAIYVQLIEVLPNANYSTLDCKISDQTTGLVFTTDSIRRMDDDIVAFYGQGNLTGGDDYILQITTTTYFATPTYRPNTFPVVANNGRVLTYNALKQELNKPSKSFFAYPFYHIGLKWGIGLDEQALEALSIFPNSTNDFVSILVSETLDVKIYNVIGKPMVSTQVTKQEPRVDVRQLQPGTYFVHLTTTEGLQTVRKLVVVK